MILVVNDKGKQASESVKLQEVCIFTRVLDINRFLFLKKNY